MQVKHVAGEIRLVLGGMSAVSEDGKTAVTLGEKSVVLTEADALQLLETDRNKNPLWLALAECRQHNAAKKGERIAELKRQLKELEGSL